MPNFGLFCIVFSTSFVRNILSVSVLSEEFFALLEDSAFFFIELRLLRLQAFVLLDRFLRCRFLLECGPIIMQRRTQRRLLAVQFLLLPLGAVDLLLDLPLFVQLILELFFFRLGGKTRCLSLPESNYRLL